jgi:hypothetical protein
MKLQKHHYIPVFYLKAWANKNRQIVEFKQPLPNDRTVKAQRKHPDGTGYIRGLYTLPGVKPEFADAIEQVFLKAVDNIAADAHKRLLKQDLHDWSIEMRSGWSRFILGMLIRSPASLTNIRNRLFDGLEKEWDRLRAEHERTKTPEEPSWRELDQKLVQRHVIILLQNLIDNERIGATINMMKWSVLDVSRSKYRFVTSDRPVAMIPGLGTDRGLIVMPLSPTKVFLASQNLARPAQLEQIDARDLVRHVNLAVVRPAIKYAWASDESQIALMQAHMSVDAANNMNLFRDQSARRLQPTYKHRLMLSAPPLNDK